MSTTRPTSTSSGPRIATAVLTSSNAKLSREPEIRQVSATYKARLGCGRCPLLGNGCYTERGNVGCQTRRLDRAAAATGATSLDVTRAEAAAVRALPSDGRPLRLQVVGDCATTREARELGAAVGDFQAGGGGVAFTYTHQWRHIRRDAWQTVSVLASCERPSEAATAHRRGYAAALVVERWEDGDALRRFGLAGVPCPEEKTGKADCHSCRLCMDANALRERGRVILFQPRRQTEARVGSVLRRLNEG